MSASQKLLKLKQRESELKQEIHKLHTNLKTETAELITDLLDYYGLLDVDQMILIGAFSELAETLTKDKKSQETYRIAGKKLTPKIKRARTNDRSKHAA